MKRTLSIVIASSLLCLAASAENWEQWRGPLFNGSSPEQGLPSKWSKTDALWTFPMQGPSASTPTIWGDKVFVSTADTKDFSLHAICLDRKSGKVLWDKKVGEGKISIDEKSNFASASPVAGANEVYFFYGDGSLVAYTHGGKELWSKSITKEYGEFAFQWTFSSSPTLYDGKLYVQVLQRNVPVHGRGKTDGPIESFLLALAPDTGKTLWKQSRTNDALAESKEAYSTPIPFEYQGLKEILIAGGDCLTGHDAKTGEELWRWATYNPRKITSYRLVPSPVAGSGIILVSAPKGDPVFAIKAGASGRVPETSIAWKSDQQREISTDVPTPLFYQGDFFVLSDVRKTLTRIEPATGKVKWSLKMPGFKKFEASPTAADGKLYVMNFGGDLLVIDAVEGSVINTIAMGDEGDDMTRSSVAISHGELFIRTNHKLYCIGKK